MNLTIEIPDRLYAYLRNTASTKEHTMLELSLSRAIADMLEKEFAARMEAIPTVQHGQFMDIIRKNSLNQEPRNEDRIS
jgi:hypothetical protein